MREHSRDRGRLEDILKYAQNVEQIVSGITYEQFVADIRIYYSVMNMLRWDSPLQLSCLTTLTP